MAARLAVLIGTGRFRDRSLPSLTTPEHDVRELARLLRDPNIARFDRVIELVDTTGDLARREIARLFDKRHREDLLLLYYSGHGVRDDEGQLHLTMEDTEQDLLSATAIPAAFINHHMDRSYSRRQLLILDCCYSGAIVSGAKAASAVGASELANAFSSLPGLNRTNAIAREGYGRVILTACGELSYAMDNRVLPESSYSLFTHFLIEGLNGAADTDQNGRISVDELYNYAYEQILSLAPKQIPHRGGNQEGHLVLAEAVPSKVPRPASSTKRRRQRRIHWLVGGFATLAAGTGVVVLASRVADSDRIDEVVVAPSTNPALPAAGSRAELVAPQPAAAPPTAAAEPSAPSGAENEPPAILTPEPAKSAAAATATAIPKKPKLRHAAKDNASNGATATAPAIEARPAESNQTAPPPGLKLDHNGAPVF